MQVRRQVRACEAVRHWETPLPMDDQEQEPPMGQIDVSHILGYPTSTGPNTTRATHLGQKDIPGFHMLYAQANISKLHLTNMKQQDKMVFGKTNLNKLILGDFCVRTFIQLISSALECEN